MNFSCSLRFPFQISTPIWQNASMSNNNTYYCWSQPHHCNFLYTSVQSSKDRQFTVYKNTKSLFFDSIDYSPAIAEEYEMYYSEWAFLVELGLWNFISNGILFFNSNHSLEIKIFIIWPLDTVIMPIKFWLILWKVYTHAMCRWDLQVILLEIPAVLY